MVACFVDLSVRPGSLDDFKEIARTAKDMGICVLGLDCESLELSVDEARSLSEKLGVVMVCRAVLKGSRRRDIAVKLRSTNRNTLIVVEAETLDVARYAAVKKSIDIIRVTPESYNLIDRSQARLFRERGWGAIEISLKPVLEDPESALPRLIPALRRAYAYGIDLILVSDASNPYELIHPRSAAGIASLAGIPGDYALSYVSTVPRSILERRRLLSYK